MNLNQNTDDFFSTEKIELLRQIKIITLTDFLNAAGNTLNYVLKVGVDIIQAKKQSILQKQPPTINAYDLSCNYPKSRFFSGIEGLDKLIDLIPGQLYEFCGLSATGKTQICNTIAINLAEKYNTEIFWVDTKNDFSSVRGFAMLNARGSEKALAKVMNLIKVERVYSIENLINSLKYILDNREQHPNLKLLVIDSLPSLCNQFLGDKSKKGYIYLMTTGSLLARIAQELNIIVLTVNIVTSWSLAVSSQGSFTSSSLSNQRTLTVALGKKWLSVVPTRILMTTDDPSNTKLIKLITGRTYATGASQKIRITDQGVV